MDEAALRLALGPDGKRALDRHIQTLSEIVVEGAKTHRMDTSYFEMCIISYGSIKGILEVNKHRPVVWHYVATHANELRKYAKERENHFTHQLVEGGYTQEHAFRAFHVLQKVKSLISMLNSGPVPRVPAGYGDVCKNCGGAAHSRK